MTWQPPIPAGALYSKPARELGPALALLAYCYDIVQRDGSFDLVLREAADDMETDYRTMRRWWKEITNGPFFCEVTDRGRRGYHVRFKDGWLDWRVLLARKPKDFKAGNEPEIRTDLTLEDFQGQKWAENEPKMRSDLSSEQSMYKEDQLDHESSTSSPDQTSGGDVDDFVKKLLREFPIGRSTARKIALTGADYETVRRSLENNGDPSDPRTYGKILDRIMGAPPETGKPYSGPYSKKPTPESTGPKIHQPKEGVLSRAALAAMARGEK